MPLKQTLPKSLLLEGERLKALTAYEDQFRRQGYTLVAGVDEAGRGPLAGPVVAAACILPTDFYLPGIDDSKKLSESQRESLYGQITAHPDVLWGVGVVDALVIDQINILRATFQAMLAAVAQLPRQPDCILVDGNQRPPFKEPCEPIVKGDSLSYSIMSASILAKVTRDRLMMQYHQLWPAYGFKEHKGYPTSHHLAVLQQLGPCPLHRKSYAPVKRVCS